MHTTEHEVGITREHSVFFRVQKWEGDTMVEFRDYVIPCANLIIARQLKDDLIDMWYENRRGR